MAASIVAVTALISACAPPPPPTPPDGWHQYYLTRDGNDTTSLRPAGADAATVVAGESNTGVNSRTLFVRQAEPVSKDHEVCVRFRNNGGITQEGVAFRVREEAGRVRAVTVTKNIWSAANSRFNVHTWDTARPGVLRQHASLDLRPALGRERQAGETWNLCGRVTGTRVDVRAWPHGASEPGWNDPTVRSATIPADFTEPGRPGWYAGHVERGRWTSLTAMSVNPSEAVDEPVDEPVDQL